MTSVALECLLSLGSPLAFLIKTRFGVIIEKIAYSAKNN